MYQVTFSDIDILLCTHTRTHTHTRTQIPTPSTAQAMQERFPACSKRLSPCCLLSFISCHFILSLLALHPQHKPTPALPHSSYLPLLRHVWAKTWTMHSHNMASFTFLTVHTIATLLQQCKYPSAFFFLSGMLLKSSLLLLVGCLFVVAFVPKVVNKYGIGVC